jgi:hypothetical protein
LAALVLISCCPRFMTLAEAGAALADLRGGRLSGAAVLVMES